MAIKKADSWENSLNAIKVYVFPSAASFWGGLVLAILITISVGLYLSYQSGTLLTTLFGKDVSFETALYLQNEVFSHLQQVSGNEVISRLPIAILWGALGLILYSIIEFSIRFTRGIAEVKRQLGYVNANRTNILKSLSLRILLRFLTLASAIIFMVIFAKLFFPYLWLNLNLGAYSLPDVRSLPYFLKALIVIIICFHVLTVLMRLFAVRPRLLSNYLPSKH
jgi:hypothetical protein